MGLVDRIRHNSMLAARTEVPRSEWHQPLCVAMSTCKIVACVIVYNVAMMCSTESVAACAIVGVINGLRTQTLMSEMLLLTGL